MQLAALVLLVQALVLLSGRGPVATPDPAASPPASAASAGTQDDVGWETYRNDEYGISLSHPATWERTIEESDGDFFLIMREPAASGRLERASFMLFLSPAIDRVGGIDLVPPPTRDTVIAGRKARDGGWTDRYSTSLYRDIEFDWPRQIMVNLSAGGARGLPETAANQATLDRILSSLTFID